MLDEKTHLVTQLSSGLHPHLEPEHFLRALLYLLHQIETLIACFKARPIEAVACSNVL